MKANMPFRTQPIRNMKTGKEDTRKRTPRLANVKSYNLDGLVRFALDNNYIEGAKYKLAKGIVKGVIEAQRTRHRRRHNRNPPLPRRHIGYLW